MGKKEDLMHKIFILMEQAKDQIELCILDADRPEAVPDIIGNLKKDIEKLVKEAV